MKYYIYISDTKVDMLYPQIPKPILKQIASSLSIDLKLLGAEVTIGAKGGSSDETRYSKVQIVSEYIEKHLDVGSVDAPSTYLKGSLPMRWGEIGGEERTSRVFFVGYTNRVWLGLGGSRHHVVGWSGTTPFAKEWGSLLSSILESLLKKAPQEIQDLIAAKGNNEIPEAGWALLAGTSELENLHWLPMQNLQFLAKTLVQTPLYPSRSILGQSLSYAVLGTPIYVAIDD